jgi:sec-independent protein translocase protein TatA
VFGSLGFPEILLILVLALLLFGPKRLPEIGRTIGRGLSEFRRASNELRRTLDAEVAQDETPRRPQPVPPAFRAPSRDSEAEAKKSEDSAAVAATAGQAEEEAPAAEAAEDGDRGLDVPT